MGEGGGRIIMGLIIIQIWKQNGVIIKTTRHVYVQHRLTNWIQFCWNQTNQNVAEIWIQDETKIHEKKNWQMPFKKQS